MDDTFDSLDYDHVDGGRRRKKSNPTRIAPAVGTSQVDHAIVSPITSKERALSEENNKYLPESTLLYITKTNVNASSASVSSNEKLTQSSMENDQSVISYKTDYPRRGVCVIISNDAFTPETQMQRRLGSDVDVNNIITSFSFLGFECRKYVNLTTLSFRILVSELSKEDHSDADCIAVFVLTHGEKDGQIFMCDGLVKLDEVISPFRGKNCPTLVGKPKLFFVQACRGMKFDDGLELSRDRTDSAGSVGNVPQRIPMEADILVAYSVSEGYYSWRNARDGSWYIQALTKKVMSHGIRLDLLSLLTLVNYSVAYDFQSFASTLEFSNKKQVPCIQSMLTKQMYFTPKVL